MIFPVKGSFFGVHVEEDRYSPSINLLLQVRFFQCGRLLLGFRGLRPIRFVKSTKEPVFVSTSWQQQGDEQISKWVRSSDDGKIHKVKSLTRRDIDLLDHAGLQEQDVYVALLRECGNAGALDDGRKVHAHLAKGRLDRERFLGNLVVQMYGKCDSLDEARRVFESIEHPNVISWNIMARAYAQNGQLQDAKLLFDRMPRRSFVSWNTMVGAYAQSGQLDESREMFELMPLWDGVSWTTMVTAYAQADDLLQAMSFFKRMPETDVVAWTTMITAYARRGYNIDSMLLFRTMGLVGLRPDRVTLISTLEACETRIDGKFVHAIAGELGWQEDPQVGTALVSMYGKCGCLETAKAIFVKLPYKDVVSWTTLVTVYTNNGQLDAARHLLWKMPLKNTVSWNVVIAAYAQNGDMVNAKKMFNLLEQKQDVVSWTTMIAGYANNGMKKESLRQFGQMVVEGIVLDRITVASMLYVAASTNSLEVGEELHALVGDLLLSLDIVTGTALANMYARCGRLDKARFIFDKMKHKDIVLWNTMIASYGKIGHAFEALELYRAMVHEGMQWDSATFTNLLTAFSYAGLQEEGQGCFMHMKQDYGIDPYVDHYTCVVDLLGRGGQVVAAKELLENMPFEPTETVKTALAAALKSQGLEMSCN